MEEERQLLRTAKASARVVEVKERLDRSRSAMEESRAHMGTLLNAGALGLETLQMNSRYQAGLLLEMADLNRRLKVEEQNLAAEQASMAEHRIRRKVLERHRERLEARHDRAARKEEEAELDEIALRRAHLKSQERPE